VEAGGMSEDVDWIARAGAKAKGKRPQYFDDPAIDRVLSIVLTVAGEVSVLRERLDTVERLLEAKGTISRADIDAYQPDRDAAHERGLATKEYVARIMRGVQQDMEAMAAAPEPSVEDISRRLREE
jgi:hypothetical protein